MSRKPARAGMVAAIAALAAAASPLAWQAYVGTWSGTATRPGAEAGTWPVIMELGPLVGSIRFPSLKCGGSLSRIRAGSSPIFSELLEYGRDQCVTGLRVRISAVTATSLRWEEITPGGRVQAYGTLARSDPPPRTAATERPDSPGSGPWVRDRQDPQVSVGASNRFGGSEVEPNWAVRVQDLPAGGRD